MNAEHNDAKRGVALPMQRRVEPVIYELGAPGRCAATLPPLDVPEADLPPAELLRDDLDLPEVTEGDLMRHYVRLSQKNWGVDVGFYPLGSCTMKYNPKVNEDAVRLPGFAETHPYQPEDSVQGNLQLMYELQEYLKEIGGFAAVSLQPAAGAHGELTGVLMMRAYHAARGDAERKRVLIPDSAHGTNPASTAMAGFEAVEVASDARGNVDLDDLCAKLDERVVGMMLTNPNTLGLFDENVLEVSRLVHEAGGLMYGDGANLNALLGIAKPGELGFDVMHYNLHKTFSTPHGGGGPGSGPVGVSEALVEFLPGPIVTAEPCMIDTITGKRLPEEAANAWAVADSDWDDACREGLWYRLEMPARSIGRVKAFYGHFGIMVRAYTYIRMLGARGLREVSEAAVLNANYLQAILKDVYPLPYERTCMHEFVVQGKNEGAPDVRALDIAKRLIDYGVHPPTNYFPLIVPEALMIEPTETESKDTLDYFADVMQRIAEEARTEPETLHEAPVNAPVRRLDEVRAARNPVLRWRRPAR
ncbi:MAG TPA: aminomethyl-transferring glycine dehydrogenase subunit GcvPB [Chloroflexi bacterium]|nr:aminomethyl-transferring glycine dehydrogenase subunit GcvPB [Chloroflexota bacterium]